MTQIFEKMLENLNPEDINMIIEICTRKIEKERLKFESEFEKCRNNICYFIETHCTYTDGSKIALSDRQKNEFLTAARNEHSDIRVGYNRGKGKTTFCMILGIWYAIFHNKKVLYLYRSDNEIKNITGSHSHILASLLSEIRKIFIGDDYLKYIDRIEFKYIEYCNEKTLNNYNMVIFDDTTYDNYEYFSKLHQVCSNSRFIYVVNNPYSDMSKLLSMMFPEPRKEINMMLHPGEVMAFEKHIGYISNYINIFADHNGNEDRK